MKKTNRKFTDKQFLELYYDDIHMSDLQIAKALSVNKHSVWARRTRLGLKPINPSKKTPEECLKKLNIRANKGGTKFYHKNRTEILTELRANGKDHYLEHREQQLSKAKAYNLSHKKEKKIYNRDYNLKNGKARYLKNKEKISIKNKHYHLKNRERNLAKMKARYWKKKAEAKA